MLVLLPGMSWYYLQKGSNFYKKMMSELQDLGPVPAFEWQNSKGETLTSTRLKKQVSIAQFASLPEDRISVDKMKYVYDQFNDNPFVFFYTFSKENQDSTDYYKEYSQLLKGKKNQWTFIQMNDSIYDDFYQKITLPQENALILLDTAANIRNFYDINDTLQMNKLITITSIIMPRGEKEDIIYEPEKEK